MAQTDSTRRVNLQSAFVLHSRPYRDSSVLLETLTHDYGRIGMVARGVRTANSRYAGLLQPYTPLYLSWHGQGDLVTLSGAEAAAPAPQLTGQQLLGGFYLNELLLRLLQRHDPHPHLFDEYLNILHKLAESDELQQTALRRFERILLQEIGYGLILEHDVDTGEVIDPQQRYLYKLDAGPIQSLAEMGEGIMLQGKTLQAIANDHYPDEETRREARTLMRAALAVHLGDRPLKSRELYRQQQSL